MDGEGREIKVGWNEKMGMGQGRGREREGLILSGLPKIAGLNCLRTGKLVLVIIVIVQLLLIFATPKCLLLTDDFYYSFPLLILQQSDLTVSVQIPNYVQEFE